MNLRIALICLPIALLLGLTACRSKAPSPTAYSCYREPLVAGPAIRRVVMYVPDNTTDYPLAGKQFGAALATELRAAGLFEVVALPIDAAPVTFTAGEFSDSLLVEAYRRHGADAVLVSGIRDYQPYWPPRVGATVHLVSTHEAVTLATVDGLWDASDKIIAGQAYDFAKTLVPEKELPHAEIAVRSPQYYNRFVARQIVAALAGGTVPPGGMPPGRAATDFVITDTTSLPD